MLKFISFKKMYFASFTAQSIPPPVATSTPGHALSPLSQILGQQSPITSQPQIMQQSVPQKSIQQQVAASEPVLQQTSAPKISHLEPQQPQQQSAAKATHIRGPMQPVVVPPNITPSVAPISTNCTVVPNAPVAAQSAHNPEHSQR